MGTILSIAAGGALGAVIRYLLVLAAIAVFPASFPWGIMIVNVVGSFLIGALVVGFEVFGSIRGEMQAFLTIGFLGAFTTFSSYSLNIIELWEKQAYSAMAFYALGSVLLSLVAVVAGMVVTKMVLT